MKKEEKAKDHYEKTKDLVKEFEHILDSISSVDDKKKMLWKQIYDNAVTDRQYASILYTQAIQISQANLTETISISGMLVKYLERMGKCNEQLIKLAELIAESSKKENDLSSDDMFAAIGEKNGK